jgi:regulator of PEP synthase PpsR (kinase-PPPase family)
MDDQKGTQNASTPPPIYVVSGNLGALGEQLARTVLAQFQDTYLPLEIRPRTTHIEQLESVVAEAAITSGTIIHTLVDPDLRPVMIRLAEEKGVFAIDAVGPLLKRLTEVIGQEPAGKPGMYRQLHATYYKRIEAIEYTMDHDDGVNPDGWADAEVVLLGVSRVGKTPISLYLSILGWKAANIPLVTGIMPNAELSRLDERRVVGLTIEPSQLIYHRRLRQSRLAAGSQSRYSDPENVYEEIEAAELFFRRNGFRMVDVTGKPIESSADEIINIVTKQTNTYP